MFSFNISIVDDSLLEGNENFDISIVPGSLSNGVTRGNPEKARVTIVDEGE